MIKILFSIAMVGVVFFVLTLFPWPDIDPVFISSIDTVIDYIYSFNSVFPVDTVFTFALLGMSIEIALLGFRLMSQIASFITGHKAPTDKNSL